MVIRYKSLDCLRAIAILLVVLAHTVLSYGAPAYLAPLQLGGSGVDLFFVLSGFLLGGQLFKEINATGRVNVKTFWLRRWMRTFPAYFAILFMSVAQRYLTKDNVEFPWQYFIFVQNYHYPLSFFSISWSIGVEEQFYLFIGLFLAIAAGLRKQIVTGILCCLLLLPFILRQLELYDYLNETHVRLDGCIMGVLIAQLFHQYKSLFNKLSKYFGKVVLLTVALYLFFFVNRYFPTAGIGDPDILLLSMIFGSWVIAANASEKNMDMFYFPGANHIATRSYSLYLIHPEVLALESRFLLELPFFIYLIVAITGGLVLAEILYRVVEKPFMDMREKYSLSRSVS